MEPIRQVFGRYGYTQFTGARDAVRILPGRFGERLAVHRERKALTLYVRRGGPAGLHQIAADLDGEIENDYLPFRDLDLTALDRRLGEVVASLNNIGE